MTVDVEATGAAVAGGRRIGGRIVRRDRRGRLRLVRMVRMVRIIVAGVQVDGIVWGCIGNGKLADGRW